MEEYKEIPVEQRRDYCNMTIRQVLAVNPIVGFSWDTVMQMPTSTQESMLDPALYSSPVGNVLIANMDAPVKDKETGALIGVAGSTFELSTIQAMVSEVKPFGHSPFVFSSGGIVAAHTDPERLGKNMGESETDTFGPFLDTMVDAITTGTASSFSYRPPESDTVIQYYAVPFSVGHSPNPWTLVVGISRNTVMAPIYRMMVICLIIGFFTIILMSAGVIITACSISRPIAHTMTILKDSADGDLTKEIAVHSQDELGGACRGAGRVLR
jgi:methyl-accepting chemotaxis protein